MEKPAVSTCHKIGIGSRQRTLYGSIKPASYVRCQMGKSWWKLQNNALLTGLNVYGINQMGKQWNQLHTYAGIA